MADEAASQIKDQALSVQGDMLAELRGLEVPSHRAPNYFHLHLTSTSPPPHLF